MQYPRKNQGITINSFKTLRRDQKSIVDQFPTSKAKLRKSQNGSGITSCLLSPKCLWKTSSTQDVPLNQSQHFQRIFLGMLEVPGMGNLLFPTRISSIKPSPGLGFPSPNCHQSTTLSVHRWKSQFFPKNHWLFQVFPGNCLWDPSSPQIFYPSPEVMPSSSSGMGCLTDGDFGAAPSHPKQDWETRRQ